MEEIFKTIENEVARMSMFRLRAIATKKEGCRKYFEGQLDALNTIYIYLCKKKPNVVQNANTHKKTKTL